MNSEPFVANNFQMINQTFCLTSVHFIVQQAGEEINAKRDGGYDFRTFCYQQLPNDQPKKN